MVYGSLRVRYLTVARLTVRVDDPDALRMRKTLLTLERAR